MAFVKVMEKLQKVSSESVSIFSRAASTSLSHPTGESICHTKARSPIYPFSQQRRFTVPDDKVSWSVKYKEYCPEEYTSETVKLHPAWADPDFGNSSSRPVYNAIDGRANRRSFTGNYSVVNGLPRNPYGRTGLTGRGLLGKWGPNHAADPIVTRWKRNQLGDVMQHDESRKLILQFVAIQRKDSGEWALPGGMVDTNENVSSTLKREFGEEALNTLGMNSHVKKELEERISVLFKEGTLIFQGYVDDPRNTDNAWIETVAMNFHDETGNSVGSLPLSAGDDAGAVQWMDVDRKLTLYANHIYFLEKVAELQDAHW